MNLRIAKLSILATFALTIGLLAFSAISAYSQETPPAPDPIRGAQVYLSNCASCHGKQGEGNVGIPNLAGAAGHVQQLGVPEAVAIPAFINTLRNGIPGNMPAFPAEILSDADIMNMGAYMFSVPPPGGDNIYRANCALCHGTKAQGGVGPALAGAAAKFAQMGLTKEMLAAGFPDLVRKGIPGKMPANPQLSDVEVTRLFDYLWSIPAPDSWEAEFEARHGQPPSDQDKADRTWSLDFAAKNGRAPNDYEWIARWQQTRK